MNATIKWFDLSRFGAALRVVPASPLKGVVMTCLEIRDKDLYQRSYIDGLESREIKGMRDQWDQARLDLGFGGDGKHVQAPDDATWLRFFSTKSDFKMSELRKIVPGLDSTDFREMSRDQVVLVEDADQEMIGRWQTFATEVLSKEAVGVWTPSVNPFDEPYAVSRSIKELDPGDRGPYRLLNRSTATRGSILSRLERGLYRQNAFIPYYSTREDAVADGYEESGLKQVDLPFALPVWVSPEGQVLGIKDVRFVPEVMEQEPAVYFGQGKNGLIVAAMREADKLAPRVRAEVDRWRQWEAKPESLTEPDALWGSLSNVLDASMDLSGRFPGLPHGSNNLAVEGDSGQLTRLKSLVDLRDGDMRFITLIASRFEPMDFQQQCNLAGGLSKTLSTAKGLLGQHARDLAKSALERVVDAVQADAPDEEGKIRHEDSGEKIGGARKDFAKRALSRTDLDSMNAMERKSLVVKKNIWPPLDYAQMREDGVKARAAMAIKLLKDSINVSPERGYSYSPDESFEADYIQAVEVVRDAVASVRTVEDFVKAVGPLYDTGRTRSDGTKEETTSGGAPLQIQWGRDAANVIYSLGDGYFPSAFSRKLDRNVGYDKDTEYWGRMIKVGREKNDAEVEADRQRTELERTLHRPHLDSVQRHGPDWRKGRDVMAQDLRDHFGFRAIEFGNWLPQDERQQVLNMAFDSLCDLAHALDLPPSSLSVGGELAVAFGSRGRGGRQAALAHFESSRRVINLTRLNGAGSVAHEWFHAFDSSQSNWNGWASVNNELQNTPMGRLVFATKMRSSSEDEIRDLSWTHAERGKGNAASWMYGQPADAREAIKQKLDVLFERSALAFEAAASTTLSQGKGDKQRVGTSFGAVPGELWNSVDTQIMCAISDASPDRAAYRRVKEKVQSNVTYLVRNLAMAMTVDASRGLGVTLPDEFLGGNNARKTNFYEQALRLDKKRTDPYWSTTIELFARAGAAYVFDQLAAKGVQSDYLVFGADEGRHANHPSGDPNPGGVDREALGDHFGRLIADYRLTSVKQLTVESIDSCP